LFIGSANFGWHILKGNYSTAKLFDVVYLVDPYASMQILASGFIPNIEILIGAFTIIVFYFLVRGRMFCSWVCPLNIVTDAASWFRKKLKIKPLISSKNMNRRIRYYVLVLGLALSAIFGLAAFETINPISMLHRALIFGSLSGIVVVVFVFLFDVFVLKYGWCGYLCPVGAFYAILGKYGIFKVFHTQENCTNCMKCKVVCPEIEVLDLIGKYSGTINSGACTNCGRCIDKCNDNSLHYKITIK
jgi:ferredoxin-type protein NapH